jgi:putative FmdB family regulatory protein
MPAYDYDCAACGRRFEVVHGLDAERPTTCPLCGRGPIRKAISAPAIHYRGSGWAKKERRSTTTAGAPKATTDGTSAGEGSTASADGPADPATDASPTTAAKPTKAAAANATD